LLGEMRNEGITKIGYDHIISTILSGTVELPDREFSAPELTLYLNGYSDCLKKVVKTLQKMSEGQNA